MNNNNDNIKMLGRNVKPIKNKMEHSVCLICGQKGYHTIIITSCQSCVTASGTPLAKFLIKIIGEEPCYSISEFICQQCFLLLDRLDTYQARAAEIHQHVSTRYKDTKYGYLGSRQRISELIVSSLTNMKNFKNGTTLNVSDELSVTVFHETLPRRGLDSVKKNVASHLTAFSPNSSSSHLINLNNNYLKRRRIIPKGSKVITKRSKCFSFLKNVNKDRVTDLDDLADALNSVSDTKVPSLSFGGSPTANKNKITDISKVTSKLSSPCVESPVCAEDSLTQRHLLSPDPEESDAPESDPSQPSTPTKKLHEKSKCQSVSNNSSSSSTTSSTSSTSSNSTSSEESDEEEETAHLTNVKLSDAERSKYPQTEQNITEVRSFSDPAHGCTTEDSTEGQNVLQIPEHTPVSLKPTETNMTNQDIESIDSHLAEAVLMQDSLASNLLHSFLSTSLWMNSSDSSSPHISSKSAENYSHIPKKNNNEDLTVESLSCVVEFIKDKKKRLELKNTGQSYINTKGKLVEAKRVWPQDCSRCPLKCNGRLSEAMRLIIFTEYWGLADYDLQREYLATHMEREERVGPSGHTRTVVLYFLTHDKKRNQVCRQFFLKTLDVSEKASRIVLEKKLKGELGVEGTPSNVVPSQNNSEVSTQ